MYIVSTCPTHGKVLEYWKETDTHTLFKCPDCDYTGEGVVHRDLPEKYNKLKAENKRLRRALQAWIDVNEGAPNKYEWAKQALKNDAEI